MVYRVLVSIAACTLAVACHQGSIDKFLHGKMADAGQRISDAQMPPAAPVIQGADAGSTKGSGGSGGDVVQGGSSGELVRGGSGGVATQGRSGGTVAQGGSGGKQPAVGTGGRSVSGEADADAGAMDCDEARAQLCAMSRDADVDVAACSSAACPSPTNDCKADTYPYPCVELASGTTYTCRGRFPDWSPGLIADQLVVCDQNGVLDRRSGLIWQRTSPEVYDGCLPEQASCTWSHAKDYCGKLGHDFRLPTKAELESIIDDVEPFRAAIDAKAFPAAPAARFWTISPKGGGGGKVWYVDFADGSSNFVDPAGETQQVRCVR